MIVTLGQPEHVPIPASIIRFQPINKRISPIPPIIEKAPGGSRLDFADDNGHIDRFSRMQNQMDMVWHDDIPYEGEGMFVPGRIDFLEYYRDYGRVNKQLPSMNTGKGNEPYGSEIIEVG